MTTYHLDREPSRPLPRRRTLLVIAALAVAAWLIVTAATGGSGAPGGDEPGPTVDAAPRDLATTLDAHGSLQRSGEQVVAHAGALPVGDLGGPSGADPGGEGGAPGADPVAYLTPSEDPSTTSPSSTTSSPGTTPPPSSSTTSTSTTSTSTTEPCPPASSTTSSTSSTSTPSTPCPPTSTTTPSTTPTTAPPPPSTAPPPTGEPPAKDGGPDQDGGLGPEGGLGPDGGPGPAGAPQEGGPRQQGGPAGDDDRDGTGGDPEDVPAATLTSALDVGATADRGTVLYTADGQPVVSLIGDLPAWRALEQGVDDGADVQQLEENLAALGYGAGLEVDRSFTAETAAAVEAWESDLGRADPDGSVALGDVVFLTAPGDVLGHDAAVGDTLQPGTPVLTLGSEQRIVVADVDAAEAGGWTPGATVELEWADDTTTTGTVFGVGREVTDGDVELVVAVATGDGGAGDRRSGSAVSVRLVDAERRGVIAVPVAAVVDGDGSPAVRVAQANGADRLVPIETGLVADGWVEVTAGLEGTEKVRLPG